MTRLFLLLALNAVMEGNARMGEEGCDQEVASSKRKTKLRLECKNRYPIYDQHGGKMAKIDTQFMTKTAETDHTLWGRTYLYSPYKGVLPPRVKSAPSAHQKSDF